MMRIVFTPLAAIVASTILTTGLLASPLEPWLAKGWTQLFAATGDLNRDGIDDLAVIIEAPEGENTPDNSCDEMDDYSDSETRRLIVAIDDGNGGESISVNEAKVVLRRDQGGVFGDPLEDLFIERGAVVVRHYGGSRWRWGNTLRFRLDGDDWQLIGMTDFWFDSLSGNNVEYDYNPLTGKMARTVAIEEEIDSDPVCVACRIGENCPEKRGCRSGTRRAKPGTRWFDIGTKPKIEMVDFACWQEKTGLLRHLGFQDGR